MLPQLSSGTTRRATVPVPRDLQAFCSSTCLTRFWRIPFKVLPYARFEAYWRHIGSAAPIVPGRAPFLARLYAAVTVPADRSKGGQPGVKRTASRISVPDSFIKPDSILTNSQVSRGQPGIRRTASRIACRHLSRLSWRKLVHANVPTAFHYSSFRDSVCPWRASPSFKDW